MCPPSPSSRIPFPLSRDASIPSTTLFLPGSRNIEPTLQSLPWIHAQSYMKVGITSPSAYRHTNLSSLDCVLVHPPMLPWEPVLVSWHAKKAYFLVLLLNTGSTSIWVFFITEYFFRNIGRATSNLLLSCGMSPLATNHIFSCIFYLIHLGLHCLCKRPRLASSFV